MNFYEKYIKYKFKFINLKKELEQIGGNINAELHAGKKPQIFINNIKSLIDCKEFKYFVLSKHPDIPYFDCTPIQDKDKDKLILTFNDRPTAVQWFPFLKELVTDENLNLYRTTINVTLHEKDKPLIYIHNVNGKIEINEFNKFIKSQYPDIPHYTYNKDQDGDKFTINFQDRPTAEQWFPFLKNIATDENIKLHNEEGQRPNVPQINVTKSNGKKVKIYINNINGKIECNEFKKFVKLYYPTIPDYSCDKHQDGNTFTLNFVNDGTTWFSTLQELVTDKNLELYIKTKKHSQPQQNVTPPNVPSNVTPPNVPPNVSRSNGGFTNTELEDILNSNGGDNNFLTSRPNSQQYTDNIPKWKSLPLYNKDKVSEFIDLLDKNQVILLTSGTGSGKTVLVPKLALAYNMKNNRTGKIGITNPKIITTESNAKYAAETLDVNIGGLVSYNYKGSTASIDRTRTKLIYQTDGILLASSIRGGIDYDTIIIDEAHERNVSIDFLLLLLKNHVFKNPQFKLIIMSATINAEVFTSYFNVAGIKFGSIHVSTAPNFPIVRHYETQPIPESKRRNRINQIAMPKLLEILKTTVDGDIVIFVATVKETQQGCEELKKICENENSRIKYNITKDKCNSLFCIELFAHIDDAQKELAVNKDKYKAKNKEYTRKVIFATNVAESSLTIDGLKYVIDIGDELKTSYNHIYNKEIIEISKISKAQVNQRIGRTGRTSEGVAYHMYTEKEYNAFNDYPKTKIESDDIISTILELINVEKSITGMIDKIQQLITIPEIHKIVNCIYRLYLLDCIKIDNVPTDWSEIDNYEKLKSITGNITDIGNKILEFRSVPLECAYAMILAKYNDCLEEMIIIMAILQEKLYELFIDTKESELHDFVSASVDNSSEHITLLNIYRNFHKRDNYGKFQDEFKKDRTCLSASKFKNVDKTINSYTGLCRNVDVSDGKFTEQSFKDNSKNDKIKLVLALAYKLNILEINEKKMVDSLMFLYKQENKKIDNLFATNISEETKYVVCNSFSSIMGKDSFTTGTKISEDIFNLIVGE